MLFYNLLYFQYNYFHIKTSKKVSIVGRYLILRYICVMLHTQKFFYNICKLILIAKKLKLRLTRKSIAKRSLWLDCILHHKGV